MIAASSWTETASARSVSVMSFSLSTVVYFVLLVTQNS